MCDNAKETRSISHSGRLEKLSSIFISRGKYFVHIFNLVMFTLLGGVRSNPLALPYLSDHRLLFFFILVLKCLLSISTASNFKKWEVVKREFYEFSEKVSPDLYSHLWLTDWISPRQERWTWQAILFLNVDFEKLTFRAYQIIFYFKPNRRSISSIFIFIVLLLHIF